MSTNTRLEPLSAERARQLCEMLRRTSAGDAAALALDEEGRVLGVVGAEETDAEHVLGDLDVHA
ncbi:MAG TPA: hypothetical protein VKA46_41810 [Gemmataceae bacterium]|nr:hypothetical protein [Gemmataceae bacterium]